MPFRQSDDLLRRRRRWKRRRSERVTRRGDARQTDRRLGSRCFNDPHIRYKPVSAFWNGLDKSRLRRIVTERLAKHFYIEGEIAFFDESLLPKLFHQLVFFDQPARVLKENFERFEDFWGDGNSVAIT